jgi:hypothetical protein
MSAIKKFMSQNNIKSRSTVYKWLNEGKISKSSKGIQWLTEPENISFVDIDGVRYYQRKDFLIHNNYSPNSTDIIQYLRKKGQLLETEKFNKKFYAKKVK